MLISMAQHTWVVIEVKVYPVLVILRAYDLASQQLSLRVFARKRKRDIETWDNLKIISKLEQQ
jgi:hypothetical protein